MRVLLQTFAGSWEHLQYPMTKPQNGMLTDIQDGSAFHDLNEDGVFNHPEHLGLIVLVGTDGVAIFKTSRQSLWPVNIAVANLPPNQRMNKNNILLGTLWVGPGKPNMEVLLKPTLEAVNKIYVSGLPLSTPAGTVIVRCKLLFGIFDMVARAPVDKHLLAQHPRHECSRPPRSITKHLSYWKAHEFCLWLLFYSLPVLLDHLPSLYLHHFSLLVTAMHILLNAELSHTQLAAAEEMLNLFCSFLPELYGDRFCTANVHANTQSWPCTCMYVYGDHCGHSQLLASKASTVT